MLVWFARLSRLVSNAVGEPYAFAAASSIVLAWAVGGLVVGFTDTWQLLINTGTTIVTFLMVFLIQGATNRSERAIQVKLNEIICSLERADNRLIAIEDDDDEHLEEARKRTAEAKG